MPAYPTMTTGMLYVEYHRVITHLAGIERHIPPPAHRAGSFIKGGAIFINPVEHYYLSTYTGNPVHSRTSLQLSIGGGKYPYRVAIHTVDLDHVMVSIQNISA